MIDYKGKLINYQCVIPKVLIEKLYQKQLS